MLCYVFQDFWRFTLTSALGFAGGVLLCFGGVALITARPKARRPAGAHLPQQERDIA
jgi:hypothetical protein